jgi:two-component system, LytTR family, response regulator
MADAAPRPLRVLIADDELMARRRLARLLASIAGVELVAECADGQEVLARLEETQADVLLLDIEMPGLTGLDAAGLVGAGAGRPRVIFTTAHPEHAVDAFDVGAVDYVLKPVEASRLARALERARVAPPAGRADQPLPVARLALEVKGEVRLVDPAEITHAVLEGALVAVHLAGEDREILTDLSLQEIERRVPAGTLERVHRQALLNLAHVRSLRPLESGGFVARTASGKDVPVSRQAARELRRRLGL